MSQNSPDTPHERLQWARRKAGYDTPSEAADAFGWNRFTYLSHENGNRGVTSQSAQKYGKAFRIGAGWILTGEGTNRLNTVQVDAYIGVNAEVSLFDNSDDSNSITQVDAPPGCPPSAVALVVTAEAGLDRFDPGDVLIYWNTTSPDQLLYRTCVVGLADGRRFIKQITPGSEPGLYTLLGKGSPPMEQVEIEWCAAIEWIKPST